MIELATNVLKAGETVHDHPPTRADQRVVALLGLVVSVALSACAPSATLVIDATFAPSGSIEGEVHFVRVVTPAGTASEVRFEQGTSVPVPAGTLTIELRTQGCAGNCNTLDPAIGVCAVDVVTQPGARYALEYRTYPVTSCEITQT